MKKIEISRFKAFNDYVSIKVENKNLLFYGDNGAGKSSIYEAIKVTFFKEKIESNVSTTVTPEEYNQLIEDLWSSYNNASATSNFEIKLNDKNINNLDISKYKVFMLSLPELFFDGELRLPDLLLRFHLHISNVSEFCNIAFDMIEYEVNCALRRFKEDIQIKISPEDGYSIKITDPIKKIERKMDLRKYFNEGKLNLIVILLILSSVHLNKESKNKNIKHLLILDDFITSLDIANRTYLIKYLLDNFGKFQIIIFTHNITFYNLIMYTINESPFNYKDKWIYGTIYEVQNNHKIILKNTIETVSDIRGDTKDASKSIEEIGNSIRKKFEVMLYEFSKIISLGGVEDSKKIIERICGDKPIYFDQNNSNSVHDLVEKIEKLAKGGNIKTLASKIIHLIQPYKKSEFQNLRLLTRELKLYQKVTMHPMSHGTYGIANFTQKELEESLDLLEKMENFLKSFVDKNIYSI